MIKIYPSDAEFDDATCTAYVFFDDAEDGKAFVRMMRRFRQRMRKTKGSSWQGRVCGFYSTELTPIGLCIESEREPGSVQIYPISALEEVTEY